VPAAHAQLRGRAQDALALVTAKLRRFDLRVFGQHDPGRGEGGLHAHTNVRSSADRLIFLAATVDLNHGQRLALGGFFLAHDRLDRKHLGHEDAVNRPLE
jgi:hypothetical protein